MEIDEKLTLAQAHEKFAKSLFLVIWRASPGSVWDKIIPIQTREGPMPHPLVDQLGFSRSEFIRAIQGITEQDAQKRILPMNCISWNVGHLAWQEQKYYLAYARGITLLPNIQKDFAKGAAASTPSLKEMLEAWEVITREADSWLKDVSNELLLQPVVLDGKSMEFTYGNVILRTIYHYWYHTGENCAIRQMLGHKDLPSFVGDLDGKAPYRPEE